MIFIPRVFIRCLPDFVEPVAEKSQNYLQKFKTAMQISLSFI